MIIRYILLIFLIFVGHTQAVSGQQKTVIYSENETGIYSLPSILLAALQQPDFIELPLMLSKDNVPVVFVDIHLQKRTNVARIFPGRSRQDGNFYLIDFTLNEIEQLSYLQSTTSPAVTQHPVSFADALSILSIVQQYLEEIVPILPVLKYPWFHKNEGKDISSLILDTLIARAGSVDGTLYLKCYDPEELQRIAKDLLPGLPVEIKLIQAIDSVDGRETMRKKRDTWYSYNYDWLFTRLGLRVISGYADSLSLADTSIKDEETIVRFISDSHGLKMRVFIEAKHTQPHGSAGIFEKLLFNLNADGLSLSNIDLLQKYLSQRNDQNHQESASLEEQPAGESSSILYDPDTLSRRLRNIE